MQKILLLLLVICPLYAQAQSWEFAKRYGGNSTESVNAITRDINGNVYTVGSFNNTIQIGNITLTNTNNTNSYIAKFDSLGNVIWATGIQNATFFPFTVLDLEVDTLGNVYLTGGFSPNSGANFGNGVTLSANSTGSNFIQTFVAKFNTNGQAQWARAMSSSQNINNYDRKLAVTSAGEIFVSGSYAGNFAYNNTTQLTTGATEKGFILKLNTNGGIIWKRDILGNVPLATYVFIDDIAMTPDENFIYPVGFTTTGNCFNCSYVGFQSSRLFTAKYDTQTGTLQDSTFSEPQPNAFYNLSATVSDSGEVYIVTNFDNLAQFGGTLLSNFSSFDALFVKANNTGNWEFTRQLSSATTVYFYDILYKNNSIILGGTTGNYAIIDSNYLVQADNQSVITLLQFSENGEFEWFKSIKNISQTTFFGKNVTGLADAGDDKFYAVGDFSFNGIFDSDTLFALGNQDLFLGKMSCKPVPISQILGDTLVCTGQHTYSLPITNFGPGIDYQWSVDGGATFTQGDTFITANFPNTGIYTISVQSFNSCGASNVRTLQVNVIDVPNAQVINGDPTACLGQSTYNVANDPFNSYNWTISGGGAVFPIGNTAIVNWAVTGNFDVNVVASNQCGTGPQTTFPVTVKAIPSEPSPIVGNNNICISTQTYSVNAVTNVNYNWSLSSGGTITANGNIATINWSSAGTHTIIVTPTNECGTGSSRTLTVNVNDVPSQPSTVVGNLQTCVGTESYSVVGSTNTNYTWALSSGGVLTSAGSSASIIWTTPGTHTLTITPSNICGTGTPRTVNVVVRNVPNQVGNFIGLDTVCIGQQNYQVPFQQGVNYTWTISGGGTVFPTGNAAVVDWTTAGTHTITVTPYNSCGTGLSRTYAVFVKNINSAFSTITGDDTVCLGIENYAVPNIGGITYDWSLNGGGTLTELNNSAFVDWSGTGVYTLNVATSDGCNSALNVEVRDAPNQPTPIAGDTVVCIGTYNYGVTAENNVNYSWTVSGGGILIENTNLATINWTTPGVYTLTVTPFNDCGTGTSRSISVNVRTIPTAPTAITGDTLVCTGNQIYTVPNNATVTYNWFLSNSGAILTPSGNQAIINWQSIDTNTITVTAANLCGTSPQTSLAVEVLDIPNVPTISGDTSTCFGNENYTIFTENYTTYNWNLSSGGSLIISNNNATVNWTNAGNHTLTVSATNQCGSATPATLAVGVSDIPAQPLAIIGDSVVCQSLKSYSVPTALNTNYTWTISGGGAISALGNVANINWTTAGTHTITVTPFNNCGTGTPITKTITVTGIPNQPAPIVGTTVTCLATTNYSITNTPNVTYTWTLNGGGTLSQNGNTATVNWQTPGVYTISVVPQTLCGAGNPRTLTVQVSDVPNTPQLNTGDTVVCVGNELYSITAVSGVTYNWSLSSGGTLNAVNNNATINWTNTGTHTLTITPSNSCGSGNSLSFTIDVNDIPTQITAISGSDDVCLGAQTYTIPSVAGESYTWTLSSGGLLSANGNSATVNWLSSGSHTLSVVPSNGCGVAPLTALVVNVNDVPAQPFSINGETSICENTSETYSVTAANNTNYTWSVNGGGTISSNNNLATINWTTPGNYRISVTPSNICGTGLARTLDVEVRANDLSTSAIAGDILVCNGSEVFYTADFNSDLDYDWFISGNGNLTQVSNSAVVQWQTAGDATIGLIPSSDCGVGDTTFLNVTIQNPLPIPTITQSGDSLLASTSEGLKWFLDNEEIPITTDYLIPQIEGIYTITAENVCGATGFSQPFIIGGATTGLFLYPNPASRKVTLRFPVYLRWYYYEIYDFGGRVVKEAQFYNGTQEDEINIRTLQSGVYYVRIYTELGYFNKKLVVAN